MSRVLHGTIHMFLDDLPPNMDPFDVLRAEIDSLFHDMADELKKMLNSKRYDATQNDEGRP